MNHSESFRRGARTVLSGMLVAVLWAYYSSPRLMVEASSNWLPRHTSELDTFAALKIARQSASLAVDGSDANANPQVFEKRASRDRMFVWSVAGFPFDAVHIQSMGTQVRYHTSVFALILNAFALVAILGGVVGLVYFHDLKSDGRSRFVVAWISVVCVFLGGSGWQITRANMQANELKRHGYVTQQESVRHPLFQMLPDAVRVAWTHFYSFQQNESTELATGDTIRTTCLADHPELHVVELSGDLSAAVHNDLRDLPFLHTLFCGRLTSLEGLQLLTQDLPRLRSLEAQMATRRARLETGSIDRSSWAIDFRPMSELEYLSLTGIDLCDFSPNAFSVANLKVLSIELGDENSFPLSIRDHRNLKALNVASSSRESSCLSIELVNLPSLVSVGTPRFRPVDLKIHQTPRLQSISANNTNSEDTPRFIASDNPSWIRSLEIENAASLPALAAIVDSPEQWKVKDCPNLRTLFIKHPSSQWRSLLGMSRESCDLSAIWNWMKGSLPINQVSLERVDLRNVDLSDWKEMNYLESIALKRCTTAAGQLRQVTQLKRLNRIVAPELVIDSVTADELLASRNNWVELKVNWSRLQSIRIVDQPKLVAAFDLKELRAKEIELENLPRLNASLSIHGDPIGLKLSHFPLLHSIVINGKIPQDAELKGLPGLRKFCVRDSTLSEGHVRFLQSASRIQSLYLPRCDVPRELVTGLSQWKHLDTIDLSHLRVLVDHDGRPGSRSLCDDDTVELPHVQSLMVLNLDGSHIGVETLGRLKACRKLQAVSLRNCWLAGDQLLPLAESSSLLELRVGRSTLVPEELLSTVEVDRGFESGETFVVNPNATAGSQVARRWLFGGNAAERMRFASMADEKPASLVGRRSPSAVEAGESRSETDLSDDRPLPPRRWRRRLGTRNSNS